jgi:hypothetical protein
LAKSTFVFGLVEVSRRPQLHRDLVDHLPSAPRAPFDEVEILRKKCHHAYHSQELGSPVEGLLIKPDAASPLVVDFDFDEGIALPSQDLAPHNG